MKKIFSSCLLAIFICFCASSQIVSNNAFLKGNFVEVGVSQCGSFGSSVCAPTGYHARGTGSQSSSCQLGFIANPAKDNWANYVGDYFLPGSPEEGWGLTVNGISYNNNQICGVNNIPGSFINYTSTATQSSATWQGAVNGLSITARTYIPVNSIYFITEVTIVNTSASAINNVYYMRNVDPDHGVLTPGAGGSFFTNNSIVSQTPNSCDQTLVSSTTLLGNYYLGLGSIDSRAKVSMGSFNNRSAFDIWNAPAGALSGLTSSGTRNNVDEAISIAFNLGNLAPNQSVKFAYTYILDANQLTEALAATNINMNINGVTYNTGNTVDICSNAPVPITITNPGGFTNWIWSPSTGLNTNIGTTVTATLTGPITYTATGSGTCGNVSVDISLNPQSLTPPGNATTISAPSVMTFGQSDIVLTTPPVLNATSYFWELPPGTVVTSASSTTNSITISVSNTAWCGKIKVYPINACASGNPAIKDVCITNIFTGNVRTNICAGDTLSVPFSILGGGTFAPGNAFTVQLSDSTGSFDNAVNIGSISGTLPATIICTIPTTTVASNLYRVRVFSSIPSGNGADNGTNITINVTRPSISIKGTKRTLCAGTGDVFTATISGGGTAPVYQWKKNGVNVGTNSTTYTDNSLQNGDIISCVLTSNAICALPAIVTSNSYYVNIAALPVVSITGSTCSGNTLTLNSNLPPTKLQVYKNGSLLSIVNAGFAATATTKAGGNGFGSNANQLASPSGVYVDDNGNVYVADRFNHRVQKFTASSTIGVTVAGGAGSGSGLNQLSTPTSVFVDKVGNLYVAESGNNRVTRWAVGATSGVVVAGGNGNGNAANQLNGPHTVFVDNGQNVYVSDQYNNRVQKWAFGATSGVTVAGSNGSGSAANQLNLPQGIYLDNDNNLYIADQGNNRVQKWNVNANTGSTVAGGNGSGAAANQLSFPTGIFVDINNNVYVTDYFNARVQKWAPNAAAGTTVAGGNGSGAAANQLSGPIGITIAKDGNMYVVEDFNNRVQKFAYSIQTTLSNSQPGAYYAVVTTASNCTATTNTITVNKSRTPTISIIASQSTLCTGTPTTVTFTTVATNVGSAPIYQWRKNGVIVGTNSPTYTDNSLVNNDSIRCTLTSNDTCVTVATVTSNKIVITVNPTVSPSVSIAAVQTVLCSGNTFDFVATPINGGTSPIYQWMVNGSNVGTNSPNFSSNTLATGNTVSCMVTSNAVCNTGSATSNVLNIAVTPTVTPTISISASQNNICSGSSVIFSVNTTNAGTTPSYQWKRNGANVATGLTYTTNTLLNNDTITCELTSNAICNAGIVNSNSIIMVVNTNLIPEVSISTATANICDSANTLFTATTINGGSAPTFQWKKNGLDVGTNSNTYSDNELITGDQISCVITSNETCITFSNATSNVITMTVNPNVVSSVSILASQSSICSGANVIFSATAINGGTSPIYQWKKNGANVGSNSSTFSTTALANKDTITCVLTANAVCATPANAVSNAVIMTVTPTVTPFVSISTNTTTVCSGNNVRFIAATANAGTSPAYQWLVNGISAGVNSDTLNIATLTNGSTVSCILTSNANCATTATATSNTITMTVLTTVTPFISITSSATTVCASATTVNFNAAISGGGTSPIYQWRRNGNIVGSNSPVFSGTSWTTGDSVTCRLTSNAVCKTATTYTSAAIKITVGTPVTPTISISTSSTNICSGVPVTFTASITNGGTTPQYSWRINGVTQIITTSNTYTTSTLVSGNIVSCILTSNAVCATPVGAVSNNLTMTVTTTVTPTISISTAQTSICGGTSATFTAVATNVGTTPIYQWQKNGNNVGSNSTTYNDNSLANGDIITCQLTSNRQCVTVATVTSNSISMNVTTVNPPTVTPTYNITCGQSVSLSALGGINDSVRWFTTSTGGTSFATSFNPLVNPIATTTYYAEGFNAGTSGSPRVSTISTSSATIIDHNAITSDDRGGLAISNNYVYIVGDGATGRYNKSDLSGGTALTIRDGFFSDLSNGDLWQLGNSSTSGGTFSSGTITSLYKLNENLVLTGTVLTLSQAINTGSGNIMGAGFGFLLFHNGSNTYKIDLISGAVTTLPYVGFISATTSESWANYGWGEFDGTDYSLCYVQSSTQIVKRNVTTGAVSIIQTFTSLSDMAACVFDASNNRLYFHHESSSQFGGSSETLGFLGVTKVTPSASCVSTRVPVIVNVTYNTPTISIAASQTTICAGNNIIFTATTTFEGSAPIYQWRVNGNIVGTNNSTYSSSSLQSGDKVTCTLISNASCLSTSTANSNELTITVDAVVTPLISIIASQTPVCPGATITFTATPTNGGTSPVFVWRKNGVIVGNNSNTYSTNVLAAGNTITCTLTSNALCTSTTTATSNTINISLATPSTASVNIVSSVTAACPGTSITFTATPTNGGTAPSYQWKVNGVNVGINNSIYVNNSLVNGDIVSCTMTSNTTTCVVSNTVNSNALTINIYTPSNITTIAGTGIQGFSGDGGLATSATINGTYSIAKDALGNIYIAEFNNHRVRKISTTGIITTIAGTGVASSTGDGSLATSASLNSPSGLAFDASGNLYITETMGHKVRKITMSTGIITTVVGTGVAGFLGDGGVATSARLNRPVGITFNSAGAMFICDGANYRVRRVSTGGIISTYFGNGVVNSSGDGGLATSASVNYPVALIFDASGNSYISELNGHRIRKINTSNIVSTIAGTGVSGYNGDGIAATTANLNNPYGIAFDTNGDLVFADLSNNRVRKINSSGIVSTIAGTGAFGFNGDNILPTNASLSSPTMIHIDASNNLLISDYNNFRIRKVTPNTATASTPTVTASPSAVCLGASSTLSIASGSLNGAANWKWYSGACAGSLVGTGNSIIVSPTTATSYFVRGEGGCTPSGAPAICGTVSVSMTGTLPTISIAASQTVICPSTTVTFTATITNGGSSPSYQWKKNGVNVGTNSNTYSSNTLVNSDIISCVLTSNISGCIAANNIESNSITIYIAGTSSVATIAGIGSSAITGNGGLATAAAIGNVQAVAKDVFGNIYISESNTSTIRKINAAGIITAFAGTGVSGSSGDGGQALNAQFNNITGMVADAAGNLYVAEYLGNRIRKIAVNGIVSTIAGTGTQSYSGDGGLATAATINSPIGLALDNKGNLFIADVGNNRIRKINSSGIISTVAGSNFSGFAGDGALATSASLNAPRDMAIDTAGNIFISDMTNQRIRRVDGKTGIITTIAGNGSTGFSGDGGPSTIAVLNYPVNIAIDENNNLYIADYFNNRIRKIDYTGNISTVLGNGTSGYNGDLLPPLSTTISNPLDIISDNSGILHIVDFGNLRIRKLLPTFGLPVIDSVKTSVSNICSGSPATLSVFGNLNASGSWKWYSSSCGGTLVGTGASVVVNPTSTSTFYVRGEGGCVANSLCSQVSVYVTPPIVPDITLTATKTLICKGSIDSFKAVVSGAGTCNTNWNYKKPIIITNNNATPLTDFQVKLTINTAALITSGKMISTGADIRFSDSLCSQLSYYIEDSINTNNTKIWVKINSIPANSSKTIYLYYGNTTAVAASSGDSTFALFDDFLGSSLNAAKWNSYGATPTVSGGAINLSTSSDAIIRSINAFPRPYISEIKVNASSGSWPSLAQLNQGTFVGTGMFQQTGSATHINSMTTAGSAYSGFFSNEPYIGNVGVWSFYWVAQNNFTGSWLGNTVTKTTSQNSDVPTTNLNSAFGLLATGTGTMTIDWFRARKYADVVPTVNTSLSESLNAYTSNYNFTINGVTVQNTLSNIYASTTLNVNDTVACTIVALNSCSTPTTSNKVVVKVISPVADTVNITGCSSITYKGNTYTVSTTLRDTVKSSLSCDSLYHITKLIVTAPPTVSTVSYNSIVYLGDTLKLNVTAINAVSYSWTGPAGFTSNLQNPTLANVTMSNAGVYYVTAISGSCSKKDSVTVSISPDIYAIKGRIITPLLKPVTNAVLTLTGTANATVNSSSTGSYDFSHLAYGNYTVKAKKNNDITKNNGVSTIDILLNTNHILGKAKLNSAYKIIAGDVSNDKKLSAIDIIFMKRLILGIDTTFSGGRLWSVVDSAYVFPDTTNPFPYKDSLSYTNLSSAKSNQTFIAFKLGDLNYDWISTIPKQTESNTIRLSYSNACKNNFRNNTISIPITVKNFNDIVGLQYTLQFNHKKYEFVGIKNGNIAMDYSAHLSQRGLISFLWNDAKGDAKTIEDGAIAFELLLKPIHSLVNENTALADFGLSLSDDITDIEAWDKDYNQHSVSIEKENCESIENTESWVVSPNPTSGIIRINLFTKSNKMIQFELFDNNGKTLRKFNIEAIKGNNSTIIDLKQKQQLASGFYHLKIDGLDADKTKTILVK